MKRMIGNRLPLRQLFLFIPDTSVQGKMTRMRKNRSRTIIS